MSLQTKFIQTCIEAQVSCSVYLVNGIKLQGQIAAQDDQSILLTSTTPNQLIFKHAVSTVVPSTKIEIDLES